MANRNDAGWYLRWKRQILHRLTAAISALLWALLLCPTVVLARQATPINTAYDPNPLHPWNQLSSALFARVAPEGTVYGPDELDILYWYSTEHLLTEPSHSTAIRILDRFIRTHSERLIRDPFKRVLLQRDLWELFDWAAIPGQTTHAMQRAALESRLATLIRRLAPNEQELAALPDNYATAAANSDLPRGLFAPGGDWVTVRSNDSAFGVLASRHTEAFNGHSVFLVMVRLPQGRQQTVDYIDSLRDLEGPVVSVAKQRNGGRYWVLDANIPQFPAGTEWALVRRLCVIDPEGHIRPTSIIESVQLRRYDSIEPLRVGPGGSVPAGVHPAQQMFELDMDKLHGGALKALAPDAADFQFVHFMSQGGDVFETGDGAGAPDPTSTRRPVLTTCYQCHAAAGIRSVNSFNSAAFSTQIVKRLQATPELPPGSAGSYTPPTNADLEVQSTVLWKYRQFDWGLLQGLWRHSD